MALAVACGLTLQPALFDRTSTARSRVQHAAASTEHGRPSRSCHVRRHYPHASIVLSWTGSGSLLYRVLSTEARAEGHRMGTPSPLARHSTVQWKPAAQSVSDRSLAVRLPIFVAIRLGDGPSSLTANHSHQLLRLGFSLVVVRCIRRRPRRAVPIERRAQSIRAKEASSADIGSKQEMHRSDGACACKCATCLS